MNWSEGLPRSCLHKGDPEYPDLLAQLPDAPAQLYVIGDVESLRPGLAVIGARRATPYGLRATRLFAGWTAAAGYVVTSGCAIGCDQEAHVAALERDGCTVAVLAGGADIAYPRGASRLLSRIAQRGAVVSEHAWGTAPKKWTFRTRNRIIAGLSKAVLVSEAALPSGTFTTADYALAAGREVLVVPGSVFADSSRGANRLLSQGATPVCDVSELAILLESALGKPPRSSLCTSAQHTPLTDALAEHPLRPDDLARAVGLEVVTIARELSRLERSGVVRRYSDGTFGLRE